MSIDIDESKVERNEFALWLAWTLATGLGMAIGYLPVAFLVSDIDLGLARVIVPILTGLLLGIAQWLVLKNYVTSSHDWILNLAGGWVAGYALGLFVVQALAGRPLGTLLGFILFGAIVAVFQWPVLRREIPHLGIWILVNIVGWTLGSYAGQWIGGAIVSSVHPTNLAISTIVVNGLTGLVAGGVIGVGLIWIVRQPDQAPNPEQV